MTPRQANSVLSKPIKFHFTEWSKIDWERLSIHVIGALFMAVGGALTTNQADPWPAVGVAVKLWAGGAVAYAGGYIQRAEKTNDEPSRPTG